MRNKVQFVWANQEDVAEVRIESPSICTYASSSECFSERCMTGLQETSMADPWYEVLSVLHLMAMVCFLQANTLLLPRSYGDGHGPRVSEGRCSSV
jgi:hypothetical protein